MTIKYWSVDNMCYCSDISVNSEKHTEGSYPRYFGYQTSYSLTPCFGSLCEHT